MEDTAIVDLYWQRSDRAIEETDKKYGRYCHTIAYNLCLNREDAEECVSDTWFRAWNLMPDKRPDILSAFLGRITRSLALDCCKARSRMKRGGGELPLALEELGECIPAGTDPQKECEARELEQAIGRFVNSLPETEQKIFISRYWYLASLEEISGRLGFTKGKTKSILFRSRKKLGAYLQEEGLC